MKTKIKNSMPFDFVLEELSQLKPHTKPMFGAYGIYIGNKIVFILRQKEAHSSDNGIWLATEGEHHASLKEIFPNMRSLSLFGGDDDGRPTTWQLLPEDSDDFEESAMKACVLVLRNDPRIGKFPKTRMKKKKVKATQKSVKKTKTKKTKSSKSKALAKKR